MKVGYGCQVHICTPVGGAAQEQCVNLRETLDEGIRGSELVGRPGLDLGERQRLVVVAEKVGRAEVGLRRPAGSAEMPRPKGASNPGPPD
jgi:hypothetical protein